MDSLHHIIITGSAQTADLNSSEGTIIPQAHPLPPPKCLQAVCKSVSNFILMGYFGTFTYGSYVMIKDILLNMLKPTLIVENHSCRCMSHSYFPLLYASKEKLEDQKNLTF